MIILDGKKLSEKILTELKRLVSEMPRKPVLAIVSVGNDPSSEIYIRNKKIACEKSGISVKEYNFTENESEAKVVSRIQQLNNDENISAIIVQLPLPKHMDRFRIFESIKAEKDADCLNPLNFGSFFQKGEANFPIGPATPVGIIKLLEEYEIKIEKKYAVLIGYSDIVGKPLSDMLLSRGATVTICHDKTHNLANFTIRADILVSATGVKHLVKKEMIKEGAVLIDVGISRDGKKITGDIDFENVSEYSSYITPVPGGVGPMTVAILLENVLRLANLQIQNDIQPISGMPEEKIENNLSSKIQIEFDKYISALTDQCETINEFKNDIAIVETETEMLKKGKDNISYDLRSAFEDILKLKPNGWISPKEQYVKKIKNITSKNKTALEKLLSGVEKYDAFAEKIDFEISSKLRNPETPLEYGDYYESCKNFFENELLANEKDIKDLEEKKRQLIIDAEGIKSKIRDIKKIIAIWEEWLDERIKDVYEEVEEFHLAVTNYFEHIRDNLPT